LTRRPSFRLGLLALAPALLTIGCDYSPRRPPRISPDMMSGPLPTATGRGTPAPAPAPTLSSAPVAEPTTVDPETQRRREIILANVVKLMRSASSNPGGANFAIATDNLNELFENGTSKADYQMTPASRAFLIEQVKTMTQADPEAAIQQLQAPKFTIRDARHIEDCMLYHAVATRVAGEGDDLTRVRRIFAWLVRNVQLVPPESLGIGQLKQAEARPADVLFRGMATEYGARFAERGWLFMALCRQIGIDAGILTFAPRRQPGLGPADNARAGTQIRWICAAIVDKKPYLFETRIGLEIPSPDGKGVATLEEAMSDPDVLERLELPGESVYGTSAADLNASPTKIGVLIDSSSGYLAPRMRLLQGQLRGEYRTILYRDPAEQAAAFREAMGSRFGSVAIWDVPLRVESLLFSSPDFVSATQYSLQFFDGRLPLLVARTAQLRGDLEDATKKYVNLRFAANPVMNNKEETPIPPEVQRVLDLYATYFLAQCQLDQGNVGRAEELFRQMLKLVPEPTPGPNYFHMLRWGALTNLGRIVEAKGDAAAAIALYSQVDPTAQHHGNLLKARALVWNNPLADPPAPLPPAPPAPAAPTPTPTPTPTTPPPAKNAAMK
jgi:hypothetical protein